jgi:hypothetical protein
MYMDNPGVEFPALVNHFLKSLTALMDECFTIVPGVQCLAPMQS